MADPIITPPAPGMLDKGIETLKGFGAKYHDNLIGGLAGSALGAGAAYATTGRRPDETQEDYEARRRSNAVSGGVAGTAIGIGGPEIWKHIRSMVGMEPKTPLNPVQKGLTYLNPVNHPISGSTAIGAVGGAAGGAAVGSGKGWLGSLGQESGNPDSLHNQVKGLGEEIDRNVAAQHAAADRAHIESTLGFEPTGKDDVAGKQVLGEKAVQNQAVKDSLTAEGNAAKSRLTELVGKDKGSLLGRLFPTPNSAEVNLGKPQTCASGEALHGGVNAGAFPARRGGRIGGVLGTILGALTGGYLSADKTPHVPATAQP